MKLQITLLKILIFLIGIWSFITFGMFIVWRVVFQLHMGRIEYVGSFFQWVDTLNQSVSVVPYIIWIFIGGLITAIASTCVSCYVFDGMMRREMDKFDLN